MILVDNRQNNNPYINLAIEEYLVRHADCSKGDYLLLYVNRPCVVVGKNQSIYREVSFDYLRSGSIQFARRISGGGTVYHDEGNLSFAFISGFTDSKVNNYLYFNQPLINALIKAGIPAEADARNNILCNGKKISGNAQFTNRKNIISHGTLLLNAELGHLRGSLRDNPFAIETKAVASVKSLVMNLSDVTEKFKNCDELAAYISRELGATQVHTFSNSEWKEIEQLALNKYGTIEWIYGRSPKTIIKKNAMAITVEEGKVAAIEFEGEEPFDVALLNGIFYTHEAIKKALENNPNALNILSSVF